MSGHHAWLDRNIAERLTFSSFSADPDDARAAEAIARPFEIVALPGYEVPKDLDRSSKDALWLTEAPADPLPVWDGFSAYALFEIIYECFGFAPGDIDGKIVVRERETGRMLVDPRSERALKLRPRREPGMCRETYRRHIGDLYAWSCVVATDKTDASTRPGEGRASTMKIYNDLFIYGSRNESLSTSDAKKRNNFLNHRDLPPRKPSRPSVLKSGPQTPPPVIATEKDAVVLSDSSREGVRRRGLTLDDVEKLDIERPGDLLEASWSVHQEASGLAKGARDDMRENRDRMVARSRSRRGVGEAIVDPTVAYPDRNDGAGIEAPSAVRSSSSWLSRLLRKGPPPSSDSDGF